MLRSAVCSPPAAAIPAPAAALIALLLTAYAGPVDATRNQADIRLRSQLHMMHMSGQQPGGACRPDYRWHPVHGGCRTARTETDRERTACPPGTEGERHRQRSRTTHILQADPGQVAYEAWPAWSAWDESGCHVPPPPPPPPAPPEHGTPEHGTPPPTGGSGGDPTPPPPGDGGTEPPPAEPPPPPPPVPETRHDAGHQVGIQIAVYINRRLGPHVSDACIPLHLHAEVSYSYYWNHVSIGTQVTASPDVQRADVHDGLYPDLMTLTLSGPAATLRTANALYQTDLRALGAAVQQHLGVRIHGGGDSQGHHCEVTGLVLPLYLSLPVTRVPLP